MAPEPTLNPNPTVTQLVPISQISSVAQGVVVPSGPVGPWPTSAPPPNILTTTAVSIQPAGGLIEVNVEKGWFVHLKSLGGHSGL